MARTVTLYILFVALIALIPASIHRTDGAIAFRAPELRKEYVEAAPGERPGDGRDIGKTGDEPGLGSPSFCPPGQS